MDAEPLDDRSISLADAENWLALGTGAVLLLVGASRRSALGACLAVSSAPLLYRGISGRWPAVFNGHNQPDSTKIALGGDRGMHVRASVMKPGAAGRTGEHRHFATETDPPTRASHSVTGSDDQRRHDHG
jgi:hypothetical protein